MRSQCGTLGALLHEEHSLGSNHLRLAMLPHHEDSSALDIQVGNHTAGDHRETRGYLSVTAHY
jgi:hypothetical protein